MVCIIEAMKVMNEIKAEVAGTVAEICAENGKPVQFWPGPVPHQVVRLAAAEPRVKPCSRKILIANRGEIALRINRACGENSASRA